MIRPLNEHAARHDDPNDPQHEKDKRENKKRRETNWEPAPAAVRDPGSSIISSGPFDPGNAGFSIRIEGGRAKKMEGEKYTAWILQEEQKRRKGQRIRVRADKKGKKRKVRDTQTFKSGADSLVVTTPPWAQRTLKLLAPHDLESFQLSLAERIAGKVEEISDRETGGMGVHQDTAVLHFHSHIFKTRWKKQKYEDEKELIVCPKSRFRLAGPWTVGADRINQEFPELQSKWKKQRLEENLTKAPRFVDVELARLIDREVAKELKRRGLENEYEKERAEYAENKRKRDKEEYERKLIEAGLRYYSQAERWPMNPRLMSKSMWRMIPRDLRAGIILSIRLEQAINDPDMLNMIKLGQAAADVV